MCVGFPKVEKKKKNSVLMVKFKSQITRKMLLNYKMMRCCSLSSSKRRVICWNADAIQGKIQEAMLVITSLNSLNGVNVKKNSTLYLKITVDFAIDHR